MLSQGDLKTKNPLPYRYAPNNKAWVTTIQSEFLKGCDTKMGSAGRKVTMHRQMCSSSTKYIISKECKGCIPACGLHQCAAASRLGHLEPNEAM